MREKQFVEQNKQKWKRFESFVEGESATDPSELSDLYTQITDDLSYARTYYSKRSIRVYLNSLAQKVFLSLYKQRSGRARRFVAFWSEKLPLALYRSRKELNISLFFFLASTAIGVLSSIHDPDFARVILGDGYIEMTNENIANGDPMAVYKSSTELDMFFRITINNILVAFRTFVLGAFFGVGTLIIMLYNGIMVGTFQYFFVEQALFKESFLTIWMHGALEISAIVIAGGAGFTMGRGLIYPGTLPRLQSFQIAARRAITIMIGLIPVFIAAGFIEGFFTRITDLPDALRGSFIGLSFLFIALYFWWFPRARFHNTEAGDFDEEQLIPALELPLDLQLVRKGKEVFSGTFTIFRKIFGPVFLCATGAAVVYALLFWLIYGADGLDMVYFAELSIYNLYQFHDYSTFFWNFFLNIAFIAGVTWFCMVRFKMTFADQIPSDFSTGWSLGLKILVAVTLFELTILSDLSVVGTFGLLALPYLAFLVATVAAEGLSIPAGFRRMGQLLSGTKRHVFVTYLSLALVAFMLLVLIDSPFTWFYVEVVQWNIDGDDALKQQFATLSLLFINHLGLGLVVPLILFGQVLEYFSAREAREANELSSRVMMIGEKRKAYGMERE